jgi:hypothetical protein
MHYKELYLELSTLHIRPPENAQANCLGDARGVKASRIAAKARKIHDISHKLFISGRGKPKKKTEFKRCNRSFE